MNRWKYVPWALGLALSVSLGCGKMEIQAAPASYADVSIEDLNIQDMIISSVEKEVASPFYKKGLSTAEDCVYIRKEPSADSEIVGKLYANAGFELLEDNTPASTDWKHIRSGNCEGYVSADYVVIGTAAEDYAKTEDIAMDGNYSTALTLEEEQALIEEQEAAETETESTENESASEVTETETETETESAAETETETETQTEGAEAEAAENGNISETETETDAVSISETNESVWTTDGVNVRSSYSTDASIVGSLSTGAKVTRTGVCDNGWSQISYNGSTAYIYSDYLTTEKPEQASSSENGTSDGASIGEQMVAYGRQFLGNPYVYGGTSLTNGADCSGYVQSIYAHFGYSIPRTATAQLYYGRQISMDELRPGDLVGYAYGGEIQHVAMYAGNGKVIHASTESTGIIESDIDYCGTPYILTRIIE